MPSTNYSIPLNGTRVSIGPFPFTVRAITLENRCDAGNLFAIDDSGQQYTATPLTAETLKAGDSIRFTCYIDSPQSSGALQIVVSDEEPQSPISTAQLSTLQPASADVTVQGWIDLSSQGTFTFASWDATVATGVVNTPQDLTGSLNPGMRVKMTQSGATIFGIITAINAVTMTIFFGTDYALQNVAITLPAYSTSKAPFGFPTNPQKWQVRFVDSTTRSQAAPVQSTWYNVGGISLTVPIGAWRLSWQAAIDVAEANAAVNDLIAGLGTVAGAAPDPELMVNSFESAGAEIIAPAYRDKNILLAVKTTYFLNLMTPQNFGGGGSIAVQGGTRSTTVLCAECGYL